jgi:hypothetical protein
MKTKWNIWTKNTWKNFEETVRQGRKGPNSWHDAAAAAADGDGDGDGV